MIADIGDHAFESANREGFSQAVIGYYDPSAVHMPVNVMAAAGSREAKSVSMQRPDKLTGGDAARNFGHKLTATAGVGHSTAPRAGSTGIGSPDSRRSSR